MGLLKLFVTRDLSFSSPSHCSCSARRGFSGCFSYVIYGGIVAEFRQESIHPHQAQIHQPLLPSSTPGGDFHRPAPAGNVVQNHPVLKLQVEKRVRVELVLLGVRVFVMPILRSLRLAGC